MSDSDVTFVL